MKKLNCLVKFVMHNSLLNFHSVFFLDTLYTTVVNLDDFKTPLTTLRTAVYLINTAAYSE
jgi:hypothetical protein